MLRHATTLDRATFTRETVVDRIRRAALASRTERFTVACSVHEELSVVSLGVGLLMRKGP